MLYIIQIIYYRKYISINLCILSNTQTLVLIKYILCIYIYTYIYIYIYSYIFRYKDILIYKYLLCLHTGTGSGDQYPCHAGTYSNVIGNTAWEQCLPCTKGKYCPKASVLPTDCPMLVSNIHIS